MFHVHVSSRPGLFLIFHGSLMSPSPSRLAGLDRRLLERHRGRSICSRGPLDTYIRPSGEPTVVIVQGFPGL